MLLQSYGKSCSKPTKQIFSPPSNFSAMSSWRNRAFLLGRTSQTWMRLQRGSTNPDGRLTPWKTTSELSVKAHVGAGEGKKQERRRSGRRQAKQKQWHIQRHTRRTHSGLFGTYKLSTEKKFQRMMLLFMASFYPIGVTLSCVCALPPAVRLQAPRRQIHHLSCLHILQSILQVQVLSKFDE